MEKFKITIPKMALVKTSLSTHYSNSHHLQFMFNVHALVKAVDKLKLHLTDELLKSWGDCIDMETELNKVANATLHAEQMAALDQQRDTLLTNLFGVIRVQQKSPVTAVKEAAQKLNKALGVYAGIQNKAADAETAEVRGLLKDLERFSTEMTALGLTPVMAELKAVNEKFQTVYNERQVKAVDEKLPALKEVRAMTDDVFGVVCRYIEGSYLLAATDEDRSLIERLVDQINQEVDHFKTAHKQSAAQKKAAPRPTAKEKEEMLKKGFAALEERLKLEKGSLSFTGKTEGRGSKRHYQLAIKGQTEPDGKPKTMWVGINKDGSLFPFEKTTTTKPTTTKPAVGPKP